MPLTINGQPVNPSIWGAAVRRGLTTIASGERPAPKGLTVSEAKEASKSMEQQDASYKQFEQLQGLGGGVSDVKSQVLSSAREKDIQYLSASTGLSPGTIAANYDYFASKVGAYSYTALAKKGIAEAETTGKGYVAGLGITIESEKKTTQPPPNNAIFTPVPKNNALFTPIPSSMAINQSNVVGGASFVSGGYALYKTTPSKIQTVQASEGGITSRVIDYAASFEQFPIISQLKGTSEFISSKTQNTILEGPINYLISPIIRGPEMFGKTAIAGGGIVAAAITGDKVVFTQGIPSSQKAIVGFVTDPYALAATAITAGVGVKVGKLKIISEEVISSKINPKTNILVRTTSGAGTEFIATTKDLVQVTTAKTIRGQEIPFTRATKTYSAVGETSGISFNAPTISRTAKLGSAEGYAPMIVQTRAATEVILSPSIRGEFAPSGFTKGIRAKETIRTSGPPGASVGGDYGSYPSGIPYSEFPTIQKIPSFENTKLSVSLPPIGKGQIYSEISPTYLGVFETTKKPFSPLSEISSIRAVSSAGKISEISGKFKEVISTPESSFYQISTREGRAITSGIGEITPAGRTQPIGESAVFPKFISPKDVISFNVKSISGNQMQTLKMGKIGIEAGTTAIQKTITTTSKREVFGLDVKTLAIQNTQTRTLQDTNTLQISKELQKSTLRQKTQTSQKELTFATLKPISISSQKQTTKSAELLGLKEITGTSPQLLKTYSPTLTRQIQATTPQTITSQYTPIPTPTYTIFSPPRGGRTPPPILTPPFLSFEAFGDSFGGKGKKLKGKYQPSFAAIQLGITTTKGAGLKIEKTGFGIRGLIKGLKK